MLVLERITSKGARVLTLRPFGKADELFDIAQPGDGIYTIPDVDYRDTDSILRAVEHAPRMDIQ